MKRHKFLELLLTTAIQLLLTGYIVNAEITLVFWIDQNAGPLPTAPCWFGRS